MKKYDFVEQLIAKMSVAEKVAQMMVLPYNSMTKQDVEKWSNRGLGAYLSVGTGKSEELNHLAAQTELKIPPLLGIDAVHGHCLNDKATIFPSQLSMACSFNVDLVEKMAEVVAKEVAADGLNWTYSPVLCLGRDLRWGRVDETFGEDKYLAGELGSAMIKGYQGEDLSSQDKVLACAKHYIGYGEATGGRDSYDTEITERKMRDVFLPPFEKAVEAGCKTFMTAYGSLDGVPCSANKLLLKDILKEELEFDGFVVTDWDNVGFLMKKHHVAENFEQASKIAIENGNDMMMATEEFYEAAISVIERGECEMTLVDDCVRRILNAKYELGLFDGKIRKSNPETLGAEEHQLLNEKIAEECVVLLKNDGDFLPLSDEIKNIAVIGESANDIRMHYGDWTYFSHPSPNFKAEPQRPYTTFLEGMTELGKRYGKNVSYAKGCEILNTDRSGIQEAVALAEGSDVIFFVCGDTFTQFGEWYDSAEAKLSESQEYLFNELVKTGKPIVLTLIASKPLCIFKQAERSKAVFTCFNGGSFGGKALARVAFGELNPCGKLPISFAKSTGEQPTYYNYLDGWHGTKYNDMPEKKSFVFGEGLSYTKFEYSNLSFHIDRMSLTVTVKNTGSRKGKEITQVYFKDIVSSVKTPEKQLIAFAKTELNAGEEKRLEFFFERKDFSLVNVKNVRVTEKGAFEIMVGGSSKDEDLLKTAFEL